MIKFVDQKRSSIFERMKLWSTLKSIKASLSENEFHKRLRDEIVMIPIPKAKFIDKGYQKNDEKRHEILNKQTHHLKSAVERVSF